MTTQETLTYSMSTRDAFKQGKIYHVADRAKCPLWVALDYLIAEEWDEEDAIKSIKGDAACKQ